MHSLPFHTPKETPVSSGSPSASVTSVVSPQTLWRVTAILGAVAAMLVTAHALADHDLPEATAVHPRVGVELAPSPGSVVPDTGATLSTLGSEHITTPSAHPPTPTTTPEPDARPDADPKPHAGKIWLHQPHSPHSSATDTHGELAAPDAKELATHGGAVLIAGRTLGEPCTVRVTFGRASTEVVLNAKHSVHHVAIPDVATARQNGVRARFSANAPQWQIQTQACEATLDGAVLFVGDAAAYIDEHPESYWRSMSRSLPPSLAQ